MMGKGKEQMVDILDAGASNVLVLTVKLHNNFYYVVDLHGSLSKNIGDSMFFINKENALTYAGDLETMLK